MLEIGAGTGANLPFYGSDVETLTVAEPEAPMARRLARRVRDEARDVAVVRAPAEQLPIADGQVDTVVSTLVLCTVNDQARALGELRCVLKPGGRLLFIEHVRSDEPRLAWWQARLNGLNRIVADTLHKAPPFVRPLIIGAAGAGSEDPGRAASGLHLVAFRLDGDGFIGFLNSLAGCTCGIIAIGSSPLIQWLTTTGHFRSTSPTPMAIG